MKLTYGANEISVQLAETTKIFFHEKYGLSYLRDRWEGLSFDDHLWRDIAGLGLLGTLASEESGGLGLEDQDFVRALEEVGYAGISLPIAETAGVIVPIIEKYGSSEIKNQYLSALINGELVGTTSLMDNFGRASFATVADIALVPSSDGQLFLIPREDLEVESEHAVDSLSFFGRIKPKAEAFREDSLLNKGSLEETISRLLWTTSAVMNGASRRMLDMTVDYAKTREQFNRPIGSFQAVKHMAADGWVALESSRPSSWYAGYAGVLSEHEYRTASMVAKAAANYAAHKIGDVALQIHGGIGFTWEYPLHYWLKMGKFLENRYGDSSYHLKGLGNDFLVSNF